jgi:hypothetical protein
MNTLQQTPKQAKAKPAPVANLGLSIDGTAYALERLPGHGWRLAKCGAGDEGVYTVTTNGTCDCLGSLRWSDRPGFQGCKHVQSLRSLHLIPTPPAPRPLPPADLEPFACCQD